MHFNQMEPGAVEWSPGMALGFLFRDKAHRTPRLPVLYM